MLVCNQQLFWAEIVMSVFPVIKSYLMLCFETSRSGHLLKYIFRYLLQSRSIVIKSASFPNTQGMREILPDAMPMISYLVKSKTFYKKQTE